MEKQSLKMENSLCSFIAFSLQDEQEPTEQIVTLKRFHLLYIYSSAKNTNPFLWEDLYSFLPSLEHLYYTGSYPVLAKFAVP